MRLHALHPRLSTVAVILASGVIGITGCSDDDDNPVGPKTPSTQFAGVFLGGNNGGRVTLSIPLDSEELAPARPTSAGPAYEVPVLANLSFDAGASVDLLGSYNEETDSLHVAGNGYVLVGAYDPAEPIPGITGHFTGPSEPGLFDCVVDAGTGSASDVQSWCGEHTQDQNLYEGMYVGVVGWTELLGFIEIEGEPIHFEGTVTASGDGIYLVHATRDLGAGTVLAIDGTINPATKDMWGGWVIRVQGAPTQDGEWNLGHCIPGTTGPN